MDINTAILCITTLVAMAGVVRIVVAIGGKASLGGQTGTLHANVWLKSPSAKSRVRLLGSYGYPKG